MESHISAVQPVLQPKIEYPEPNILQTRQDNSFSNLNTQEHANLPPKRKKTQTTGALFGTRRIEVGPTPQINNSPQW